MMGLSRRGLGAGLAAVMAAGRAGAAPSPFLSIADNPAFRRQPADVVRKRFDLYRSLGIGMLRVSWGWRQLERAPGNWAMPEDLAYLKLARDAGFGFKMNLDDINAPPGWFLAAHPEAAIRARNGAADASDLSLWLPGLHALLDSKMDMSVKLLLDSGIFDAVRYLVIGLGPGGEPRAPLPWLPGAKHVPANLTFWYYDDNARRDFIARMTAKYQSIARANAAWGASFPAWSDVTLPDAAARTHLWADVLPWQRDSLRSFWTWQIGNVRDCLHRHASGRTLPRLMMLVIGATLTDAEWRRAMVAGHPGFGFMIGADTDFLLDLAHREGLWIQETGGQSEKEIAYMRQYMAARGYDMPMWIENSGGAPARSPMHLADMVERYNLQGLEYIDSATILEADGLTPTPVMAEFKQAIARLRGHFRAAP